MTILDDELLAFRINQFSGLNKVFQMKLLTISLQANHWREVSSTYREPSFTRLKNTQFTVERK
jgi:hypothetical protein